MLEFSVSPLCILKVIRLYFLFFFCICVLLELDLSYNPSLFIHLFFETGFFEVTKLSGLGSVLLSSCLNQPVFRDYRHEPLFSVKCALRPNSINVGSWTMLTMLSLLEIDVYDLKVSESAYRIIDLRNMQHENFWKFCGHNWRNFWREVKQS